MPTLRRHYDVTARASPDVGQIFLENRHLELERAIVVLVIDEQHGLRFSGLSPDGVLPEIVEYEDHPWFIGVQFHPELKSRPFEPHPLFASFIQAAMAQSRLV